MTTKTNRRIPERGLLAVLFCISLGWSLPAWTQPSGAQGEYFLHRVMAGDTLLQLSERYTLRPDNWQTLQQLNRIADPYAVPIGIMLRIPLGMIPRQEAPARIVHVQGQATAAGQVAAADQPLSTGSRIQTGDNSHVTLELADGTLISLPSRTDLNLENLQQFQGTKLGDTVLHVDQGSIDASVAPDGQGVGRFEVRTPVAVTGVRGTRFRLHADSNGQRQEVLHGRVHVSAEQESNELAVAAGQGLSIDSTGNAGEVRLLLPAPEPIAATSAQPEGFSFQPVAGAVRYQARQSSDADGHSVVAEWQADAPWFSLPAAAPGEWYMQVSAVDAEGLQGATTTVPFTITARYVRSEDGQPIALGSEGFLQSPLY
ncbi:FecR domain-containing protein [Corticimicrobacter populi]|uniref:Peptidoglycan-binding protein n=1 Tax=Corticimicrobacter populi TaxID=2175229 RepID=A0A2V1JT57_9BURK|nr:FecR domain-containing protein [Corticimicrobacter populi]PWF20897.1 peptidoglycan-binding protein [Corticimicrobacter populi]